MLEQLKADVYHAHLDLVAHGLVTLTWGNVSALSDDGQYMVIKPSGVPYGQMLPEQMVVIDLNGQVVEGEMRPSSDTPTHLILYKHFTGVRGITHTHSPQATAFAQARVEIPCLGTTHADHFFGAVPVTRTLTEQEVITHYEKNTGRVIVERFRITDPTMRAPCAHDCSSLSQNASNTPAAPSNRHALPGIGIGSKSHGTEDLAPALELDPISMPAVLVAGHGPFTWGGSAAESVTNAVALEAVAEIARSTYGVRSDTPRLESHLLDKHYQRKHGAGAYYGQ